MIRLWRERLDLAEPSVVNREWLVQVEYIPSGEKEYFASLDDLFVFIREQLSGNPATENLE